MEQKERKKGGGKKRQRVEKTERTMAETGRPVK